MNSSTLTFFVAMSEVFSSDRTGDLEMTQLWRDIGMFVDQGQPRPSQPATYFRCQYASSTFSV